MGTLSVKPDIATEEIQGDGRPGEDTVSFGSIHAFKDTQFSVSHLISLALTCFQN